jgi:hypothetical protein
LCIATRPGELAGIPRRQARSMWGREQHRHTSKAPTDQGMQGRGEECVEERGGARARTRGCACSRAPGPVRRERRGQCGLRHGRVKEEKNGSHQEKRKGHRFRDEESEAPWRCAMGSRSRALELHWLSVKRPPPSQCFLCASRPNDVFPANVSQKRTRFVVCRYMCASAPAIGVRRKCRRICTHAEHAEGMPTRACAHC